VKEEKATERLQQELKRLQQYTAELEQAESERKQAQKALVRRASQLQIIGEVSRKVSSILNVDELLSYVIKAIQESFDYYHVDIFLIDQDQGYAVFKTSSNPTVEKVWKEQKLRFKLGEEGMIGWAAQSGEPLLANDVTQEPLYLPDKSLPETKSELVVPLKVDEQTFGVLDVQSSELDAFNADDVFVLETLGNQVAIAIQNA
jgi:GAF domain-containing protein